MGGFVLKVHSHEGINDVACPVCATEDFHLIEDRYTLEKASHIERAYHDRHRSRVLFVDGEDDYVACISVSDGG